MPVNKSLKGAFEDVQVEHKRKAIIKESRYEIRKNSLLKLAKSLKNLPFEQRCIIYRLKREQYKKNKTAKNQMLDRFKKVINS